MKSTHVPAFAVFFALSALAPAQNYPIGYIDFGLQNRTNAGTPILQSRIYYPAQWAGYNAPIRPQSGGYPTFVWLHGNGSLGRDYIFHGQRCAESGWIAVLQDTAQWDQNQQYEDAKAAWNSLAIENLTQNSFFHGAIDMTRSAVGGYSVGGMAALRALAANVGYKAGFAAAPTGGSWVAPNEFKYNTLPFCIVQGTGDSIVWWQDSLAYWQWSKTYSGQKLFYLMNNNANHINVASVPSQWDQAIFNRSMSVMLGFLGAHVRGDTAGLETAIGGDARSEPNVTGIYSEIQQPRLWVLQNGRTASIRETSEPGGFLLMASLKTAYYPTPFGDLLLDPGSTALLASGTIDQTRLFSMDLPIPNDPIFQGKYLALQALGVDRDYNARLSDLALIGF